MFTLPDVGVGRGACVHLATGVRVCAHLTAGVRMEGLGVAVFQMLVGGGPVFLRPTLGVSTWLWVCFRQDTLPGVGAGVAPLRGRVAAPAGAWGVAVLRLAAGVCHPAGCWRESWQFWTDGFMHKYIFGLDTCPLLAKKFSLD